MALGNLSALGLHQRAVGTFSKVPSAGHSFTTGRISPLGLHQPTSVAAAGLDASVNLIGGKVNAEPGIVVAQVPVSSIGQFGPLGLVTKGRVLDPVVGNVTVTLVGASANAQGEELEGSRVVIRLDGGEAIAGGGTVTVKPNPVFGPDFSIINANATTDVPVSYVIDDMSGFKLFREKGQTDGYGRFTVMGDPKQPQDSLRSRGNSKQTGPASPEPTDIFVSGDYDPDDF